MKNHPALAALILSVGLMAAGPAAAQGYQAVELETLGGSASHAQAINNAGDVAGYSFLPGDTTIHAARWDDAQVTDLGAPGGTYSLALGINAAGRVAGFSLALDDPADRGQAIVWNGTTPTILGTPPGTDGSLALGLNNAGRVVGSSSLLGSGEQRATVWAGGTGTLLPTLGGSNSEATAINSAGRIAGFSTLAGSQEGRAVVWNGNTITALDTLGGTYGRASDINNRGQVVGTSRLANEVDVHATLWNGTTATDLGTLGGSESLAMAINNQGQVVGQATTTGGARHAVLWDGGTAIDLNLRLDPETVAEGWVLMHAFDINDRGQIVADGINSVTNEYRAFVLTPVPEPATVAMLAAGAGLLGLARHRRRPR